MKSEHRSILAIALAAAFFIFWMKYMSPPPKPQDAVQTTPAQQRVVAGDAQKQPEAAKETAAKTSAGEAAAKTPDPQANIPVKTWTLKNSLVEVDLTGDDAAATAWRIFGYRQTADKNSPARNIVATAEGVLPPLALAFESANFAFPKRPKYELASADETKAVFIWRSPEVEVTKTISLEKDSYLAGVEVAVKNKMEKAATGRASLSWSGVVPPQKSGGFLSFVKGPQDTEMPVFYMDGKVWREKPSAKMGTKTEKSGNVLWSGLESRYFIGAVIPRIQGEGLSVQYGEEDLSSMQAGTIGLWAGAALPAFTIPTRDSAKNNFSIYAGPKNIDDLKQVGVRLEEAIDYGWFTIIAMPILYLLKFFYNLIHNYGVAIILLTIFVKLLLHPINVKSLKSMKAMQMLQPKLKEIQKKYAGDKQRINAETMQLFKSHKVNPMGGCLPMLLQLPIYIALYKVLWNSIELYHAPFFWFYKDLSAPDPYFITPILLGLFMVAQQKLTPQTSADPAQQKMMMIMPVMFSVFMLFLPSGLVFYILVNTVMSVVQQYMYNHGIGFMDIIKKRWQLKAKA